MRKDIWDDLAIFGGGGGGGEGESSSLSWSNSVTYGLMNYCQATSGAADA